MATCLFPRENRLDYLVKPVTPQNLTLTLHRFFETLELRRDLAYWQSVANASDVPRLAGDSEPIIELRRLIDLFAQATTPVLILGEPGTGKETAARTIHSAGARANGRFVAIDCNAGLDPAELFGSWQAGARQEGLLAAVGRGTIYLSGIERLGPEMQIRLLRAIETRSYRPSGSSGTLTTEVRFILSAALTGAELRTAAAASELLQYLCAFVIEIPPLRDRRGDIPGLAQQFLEARDFQRAIDKSFSDKALRALAAHSWPGNVRELRSTVELSIILSQGKGMIGPEHLNLPLAPDDRRGADNAVTLRFSEPPTLDDLRDAYVEDLLSKFGGNRRKVAEVLGISERNLYRIIKPQG